MTNVNEIMGGGKSLKAADLIGKPPSVVTITGWKSQEFDETKNGQTYKKKKIVLSFRGTDRTFVCNKTNCNVIEKMYGSELEAWIGQKIVLKAEKTDYAGQRVDCIRVGDPNDKIQSGPPPKKAPVSEEMDDEIPF